MRMPHSWPRMGLGVLLTLGCQVEVPAEVSPAPERAAPAAAPQAEPDEAPQRTAPLAPTKPAGVCSLDEVGTSFNDLFNLGERCAEYAPLSGALRMAERVPEPRRWIVYDGIAHGLGPVPEDPSKMAETINSLAPPDARQLLHDGVIRGWTEAQRAAPERVLPWVTAYVEANGLTDGRNGVRIGLQRSLGEDLPEAIRVAQRYPPEWQVALMEELGWRAGNDVKLADVSLQPLLKRLPEDAHCAFVQGAARGWTLNRPWSRTSTWPVTYAFLSELPEVCHAEMITGVAWGLHLLGGTPAEIAGMLDSVVDTGIRGELDARVRRIEANENTPIWEP